MNHNSSFFLLLLLFCGAVLAQSPCVINSDCVAGTVNWSVGANNCTASVTATSNGANATATDSVSAGASLGVGTAAFRCNSGNYTVEATPAPTCAVNCPATTLSWTVSSQTCEGTVPDTSFGASSVATDSTPAAMGGATFTCNSGTWSAAASATCSNQCAYLVVSWEVGGEWCYGDLPATAEGASAIATDSVSDPAQGSATYLCSGGVFSSLPTSSTCSTNTAPTNLALVHTNNNRGFTVSWTAGSGNGGASGCKIQYQRNGTTWTDLLSGQNCDANTTNLAVNLPGTSSWTNNFNGTGVAIRIARVSDGSDMGIFPQRTRCVSTSGSSTPTPTFDEDCDARWDDTADDYASSSTTTTFGSGYNCGATYLYGGLTYTFDRVTFTMTGGMNFQHYSDTGCGVYVNLPYYYGSNILYSSSGTVPNCLDASSNGVCYDTTACQTHPTNASSGMKWVGTRSAWDSASCRYALTLYY